MQLGGNNTKNEFISLADAAKYCKCYSQDYLSLRARQGKLRSVKLGRNWVTTQQWVDEYLRTVNDYNNNRNGHNGHTASEPKKIEKPVQSKKTTQPIKFIPVIPAFHFTKTSAIVLVGALGFILLSVGAVFGFPYYKAPVSKIGLVLEKVGSRIAIELAQQGFEMPEKITAASVFVMKQTENASAFLSGVNQTARSIARTTKLTFTISPSSRATWRKVQGLAEQMENNGQTFASQMIVGPARIAMRSIAGGAQGIAEGIEEFVNVKSEKVFSFVQRSPKTIQASALFAKDFAVGSFMILKYNVLIEVQQDKTQQFAKAQANFKKPTALDDFKAQATEGATGIFASISDYAKQGAFWTKIISQRIKDNVVDGALFVLRPWLREDNSLSIINNYPATAPMSATPMSTPSVNSQTSQTTKTIQTIQTT